MIYDPRPDLLYLKERQDKLEASMKAVIKALQLFLENTNCYDKENKDEDNSIEM